MPPPPPEEKHQEKQFFFLTLPTWPRTGSARGHQASLWAWPSGALDPTLETSQNGYRLGGGAVAGGSGWGRWPWGKSPLGPAPSSHRGSCVPARHWVEPGRGWFLQRPLGCHKPTFPFLLPACYLPTQKPPRATLANRLLWGPRQLPLGKGNGEGGKSTTQARPTHP